MITYQDITAFNSTRLVNTGIEEWDDTGVLHLKGLIPTDLIDTYVEERKKLLPEGPRWDGGWNDPCPYLRVPTMKTLALHRPLTQAIKPLIGGDEPGLHLCLTGFKSTERAWHQDRYLNPEYVGERYIAAWIALDDVHPDSGPFEYVPGSHRWPVIQRSKVWSRMRQEGQNPDLPTWPSDSQGWLGAACDEEIKAKGASPVPFLGKKGDVLLWHASLMHRGSMPKDRSLERRALIAHYSSVHVREDMPQTRRLENGSFYFHFDNWMTEPDESTHKPKQM